MKKKILKVRIYRNQEKNILYIFIEKAELSSTKKSHVNVSYLKTMNNDEEDEEIGLNPNYLEKIQILSPKKICNFNNLTSQNANESCDSLIILDSKKKDSLKNSLNEGEKPFNNYNCESVVENLTISEKMMNYPEFNVIKSQVLEKPFSDKSFGFYNDNNSNFSPKIEEDFCKPLERNEDLISNNYDTFMLNEIKTLFSRINLDKYSLEEIVDAIFSNDMLRKINFTIFKIKFEVNS